MKNLLATVITIFIVMTGTSAYAQDINTPSTATPTTETTIVAPTIDQNSGETIGDTPEPTPVTPDTNPRDEVTPPVDLAPADETETAEGSSTLHVINQGDGVFSEYGNLCTVGYVTDGFAYLASHCINGDNVRMYDTFHRYIGRGYRSPQYNEVVKENEYTTDMSSSDVGVIALDKNTTAGENVYTGDTITTDVSVGDQVCVYGMAKNDTSCGVVLETREHTILASTINISGDSGGPAWIPGKGFVGYANFVIYHNSQNKGMYNIAGITRHAPDFHGLNLSDIPQPGASASGIIAHLFRGIADDIAKSSPNMSRSGAEFFSAFIVTFFSPVLLIADVVNAILSVTVNGNDMQSDLLSSSIQKDKDAFVPVPKDVVDAAARNGESTPVTTS